MLGLLTAAAFAAEPVWVDVHHTPPESVPLFSHAQVVTVKGTHKGDDCEAAVANALLEGEELGRVLRVVVSSTDLVAADRIACKQRYAGEDVSASTVELNLLVVSPQPGSAATVSPERAIQMAALLSVLSDREGEMAPLVVEAGKAWVSVHLTAEHDPVDSVRYGTGTRGAKAFVSAARPWLARSVQVLRGLPEVEGVRLEVDAAAHDPTRRGRRASFWERYRFDVSTANASRFESGDLLTEELMVEVRALHTAVPQRGAFREIELEP